MNLAVTALAEFVHRRGDLHPRLEGRTRAEEGVRTQQCLQQARGSGYQRERPVALAVELAGEAATLSGRIDGCCLSDATLMVEEFKTTRADFELAHRHHGSVHWAQARLYGALLVRELDATCEALLRLVYAHPDTLETRVYERRESAQALREFLDCTLAEYAAWLSAQQRHRHERNSWLRELDFPFPQFRPHQRSMARRAFRALRDREHLLLEAPTGSGKTLAMLFPAVKSLAASHCHRVMFLTSRGTGALSARGAAEHIDPAGRHLRHVTIIARDKACFVPGTPCDPDVCGYARGYYDRASGAVEELLEAGATSPERVAEVARRHQVCPFELSLDAARWSDLVIADYNYLLDPVVRLQRFDRDPDMALLIDESHQLAPRVRDMLSVALERDQLKAALAEAPPEDLARRLRSLDRALSRLRREADLGAERVIARPQPLLRSMQRFADTMAACSTPLDALPATRDLWLVCSRWLRSESWYDPERFRHVGSASGRNVSIQLCCLDPGNYLRGRLDAYGGHVRFSGTVSPLALYAHLHGESKAPVERAGNPYQSRQLRVLVVDDVPTYLRARERSLDDLVDVVAAVVGSRRGHYLVAFPSFAYLERCADAFTGRHPQFQVARQWGAMDEAARADFLAGFADDAAPRVGFVVLGGVFGESVDFSGGARLAGVVCVGVGLPPPSLVRRELQARYDDDGVDGRSVAYHLPAMVKVLQMAGRLLRGPDDRGVLCLVDPRFRDRAFRRFFPDHWHPRVVSSAGVATELEQFWCLEPATAAST